MIIDPVKSRKFNNYPFYNLLPVLINNNMFPSSLIESLAIQLKKPGTVFLLSISVADSKVIFSFISSTNVLLSCQLGLLNTFSFIKDSIGCPAGSMLYSVLLCSVLLAMLNLLLNKLIRLHAQLLPLCVILHYISGCQAVQVDGVTISDNNQTKSNDINIFFTNNLKCIKNSTAQLNLYGDVVFITRPERVHTITVNDTTYNVDQKQAVIKHTVLSDLRVVTADNTIKFLGVTDAT